MTWRLSKSAAQLREQLDDCYPERRTMTITYQEGDKKRNILRFNEDGSVSSIPVDDANSDYQRYLRWLENPDAEEGGTL